jgi:hypothetical protein
MAKTSASSFCSVRSVLGCSLSVPNLTTRCRGSCLTRDSGSYCTANRRPLPMNDKTSGLLPPGLAVCSGGVGSDGMAGLVAFIEHYTKASYHGVRTKAKHRLICLKLGCGTVQDQGRSWKVILTISKSWSVVIRRPPTTFDGRTTV